MFADWPGAGVVWIILLMMRTQQWVDRNRARTSRVEHWVNGIPKLIRLCRLYWDAQHTHNANEIEFIIVCSEKIDWRHRRMMRQSMICFGCSMCRWWWWRGYCGRYCVPFVIRQQSIRMFLINLSPKKNYDEWLMPNNGGKLFQADDSGIDSNAFNDKWIIVGH